jgi:glycosyltransferase involved in cell wall biosynthesis
MRLLVATPLYPPEPGGPATYARIIEHGLPERGIDVTVVPFSDVRIYPKGLRHLAYLRRVWKEAGRVDAILALDPVSVGLPALIAARLRGVRFIVKVVGDYAWEQGTQRFGVQAYLDDFVRTHDVPLFVKVLRAVQTYVASSAMNVIVPSLYLKRIVMAWGVKGQKIEVIYNSIELEEGGVVPGAVAAAPRPKVVTVGRLVPWKHVDGVTAAVAMLDDPASLIIVGDGPSRAGIERHAFRTLGTHAHLTGALSHPDTLATIADADVLVLNSSYEGLSHLLIEAQMLKVPVVATNVGGNPELITHEENGLLVPPYDTGELTRAIKRMIEDREFAERLAAHAQEQSTRFSPQIMLDTLTQLLKPV